MTNTIIPVKCTPSKIIIDKRGDVLLKVGKDEEAIVTLLVSSKILSLASKVFEAMFNNGFAEGQDLSSVSPREISLPDDDPKYMTTICKLVHMQTSDIPDKLEISALADFAVLCDKYDCTSGVRPWSRVWMSRFTPELSEYAKLLTVSYLLDLPQEFHDISQNLLRHRFDIDMTEVAVNGHEFLPLQVINFLQSDQTKLRGEATAAILSEDAMNILKHSRECERASVLMINFFRLLHEVELLPIQVLPLVTYEQRARAFDVKVVDCGKECAYYHRIRCDGFQAIKSKVLKDINKVVNRAPSYCLDCVKRTFSGWENMACRVAHITDSRFLGA